MAILTPWFSVAIDGNPVRPGYYDATYASESVHNSTERRYWTGVAWRKNAENCTTFFGHGDTSGEYWRGLTAPAK